MAQDEVFTGAERGLPARRSPLRRLLRDPQAVVTTVLLVTLAALGLLASAIAQHDPNEAPLGAINLPIGTPDYPLGADQSGRDILARLLHSINTSMVSALIGTSVALLVGVSSGLIGGYFSSRVRTVTEWTFNLIQAFPGMLLLIVLVPITHGDYRVSIAIFGVLMSPGTYRIVRNQVVGVKNELFVDAARVSGLTNLRILGRHVLFVVRGPVIINAAFLAGAAINVQAGLSFLGVGSNLVPSFGAMIADAFNNLYLDARQVIWPALTLGVIAGAFVLLGNSLRDALAGTRPKPVKLTAPAAASEPTPERSAPTDAEVDDALLVVEDLGIGYRSTTDELREVVSGVSLRIQPGEVLGLVGESGSGKTQTAFAVLGVLPTEAVVTRGSVRLAGRELVGLPERELRQIRGRQIAYIPQEPMSNLVPTFTVGAQLVQSVRATLDISRKEARARVLALLERVEIADPRRVFASYPHQISGGMAQRVLIAGAVASRPKLLIADEPTTALDVTVQAEVLDLLRDLQAELGMAVLLVTHNFGVVADICDRVAVMQEGQVVEAGRVRDLFRSPRHPYTRMLLDCILDEETIRTDPPVAVGAGKDAR